MAARGDLRTAEVAHIGALRDNGPRAVPAMVVERRDADENSMVLHPSRHGEVDEGSGDGPRIDPPASVGNGSRRGPDPHAPPAVPGASVSTRWTSAKPSRAATRPGTPMASTRSASRHRAPNAVTSGPDRGGCAGSD